MYKRPRFLQHAIAAMAYHVKARNTTKWNTAMPHIYNTIQAGAVGLTAAKVAGENRRSVAVFERKDYTLHAVGKRQKGNYNDPVYRLIPLGRTSIKAP